MAVESHSAELKTLFGEKGISVGSEVPKTLGDVGAAFALTNPTASLLVMQARSA